LTLVGIGVVLTGTAAAGELDLLGVVSARGISVRGQRAWLEDGFGRLGEGGEAPSDRISTLRGVAHLGFDWTLSTELKVHAHGLLQAQPERSGGREAGVVEAFALYRRELSPKLVLRIRAGTYFPQTSRENVDPLWSSPYTITLSTLNSWIGEEVRLTGAEVGLAHRSDRGELQVAGGAFGLNDSTGALLAWRGWALGDRLVTLGEVFPLPPLASLQPGGGFADQRGDGTRPIEELDGRIGWNARARWEMPGRLLLQAAYLDNRGDRALHRGQYSWRTRLAQAGLELPLAKGFSLIAEGAQGDTGMGTRDGPHVDMDFRTAYAMLTWSDGKLRFAARYEAFKNVDRDGTQEPNGESGRALTLAAFVTPIRHLRIGVEALDLRSDRPAAADSGFDSNTNARRGTLELRLLF
jgi:hypothetical protein